MTVFPSHLYFKHSRWDEPLFSACLQHEPLCFSGSVYLLNKAAVETTQCGMTKQGRGLLFNPILCYWDGKGIPLSVYLSFQNGAVLLSFLHSQQVFRFVCVQVFGFFWGVFFWLLLLRRGWDDDNREWKSGWGTPSGSEGNELSEPCRVQSIACVRQSVRSNLLLPLLTGPCMAVCPTSKFAPIV